MTEHPSPAGNQDTFKHQGMRKRLIREVLAKGIQDEKVLEAMLKIPRHYFLDSSFTELAYEDKAFPIGSGQTISQPYTVAFQSQLLEIKKGDKVLEVGTGSGYQASVLCEMGAKVYSIERQKNLFIKTRALLKEMNYHPNVFYGDGYKGLPAYAPFDKIIVTAGAPFIPKDLLLQMKVGGIMVIPVGEPSQVMKRIVRINEKQFEESEHGYFSFVPLLGNKAND